MNWIGNTHEFSITITTQEDALGPAYGFLDFAMRYAFYAALTAILVMIVALITKLMWNCDTHSETATATASERIRLFPSKERRQYGTSYEDLESGVSCCSSEEELYDGKICVICYDDRRNCFFIPCGHCVTCQACAHRIIQKEMKTCPICRAIIHKIGKLQIL